LAGIERLRYVGGPIGVGRGWGWFEDAEAAFGEGGAWEVVGWWVGEEGAVVGFGREAGSLLALA
jgi:hypothetical protein